MDAYNRPYGLDVLGMGYPFGFTNLCSVAGTLDPIVFGNWKDLVHRVLVGDRPAGEPLFRQRLQRRQRATAWCDDVGHRIASPGVVRVVPAQSDTSVTDIEHRAFVTAVRAQGRRLVGYAATFGTPAEIDGRLQRDNQRAAHSATR